MASKSRCLHTAPQRPARKLHLIDHKRRRTTQGPTHNAAERGAKNQREIQGLLILCYFKNIEGLVMSWPPLEENENKMRSFERQNSPPHPILLRNNWHTSLCKFKVYTAWWCDLGVQWWLPQEVQLISIISYRSRKKQRKKNEKKFSL